MTKLYLCAIDHGDLCHTDLSPMSLHKSPETAKNKGLEYLTQLGWEPRIPHTDFDRVRIIELELED